MCPTTVLLAGPADPLVAAAVKPSSVAGTGQPVRDAARRSARLYDIGIAVVFSLMLAVLVVVGVMLWSR